MRNPSFTDRVQAAMLKHELSLIPQRARFQAAIDQLGPGATPALVVFALFPNSDPLPVEQGSFFNQWSDEEMWSDFNAEI